MALLYAGIILRFCDGKSCDVTKWYAEKRFRVRMECMARYGAVFLAGCEANWITYFEKVTWKRERPSGCCTTFFKIAISSPDRLYKFVGERINALPLCKNFGSFGK